MKSIQTLLSLLLAFVLLCGCEKTDATASNAAPGGTNAAKKLKIGVSIPAADHGWTAGVGYWAKTQMAKYPDIEWVYATASDSAKQTSDIEDMMTQSVDGLVVLAMESAPLTPVAEKAKQRGIYLVSVDRGFVTPIADVFLEGDNGAYGRKSAEYIVEKMGGKGNLVLLRGVPSTVDTARYDAAMEVFNKHPDIKILGAQPGMWNQQHALEVMQGYLAQFPKIDAVWASDDDMAQGVERAIKEAGRSGEMWIMPGAGMKEIVKRVMDKDPLYPADITYPPGMIAAGIDLAVAKLRDGNLVAAADDIPEHLGITKQQLEAADKQEGQKKLTIDVFIISPDNASKYYFPDSIY
jgi:ribose transport system substrate-binding protein